MVNKLDEEIQIFDNYKDREKYESLAEIYSIIVALDKLERAFLRDVVDHNEYTPACLRLLAQYNTLLKNETVAEEFGDLDSFKQKYHMSYANATARLKIGVPATVEQQTTPAISHLEPNNTGTSTSGGGGGSSTPVNMLSGASSVSGGGNASSKAVAEATGNFITTMDGLKLNFRAKDQLHPLLSELMQSLNKVTSANLSSRGKLVEWLIKLNGMKVNEELSDEDARQLLFDLDNAYKEFYTSLD